MRSGTGLWGGNFAVVASNSQLEAQPEPLLRCVCLGEGLRHSCLWRPYVSDSERVAPFPQGPPAHCTSGDREGGGLSEKLARVTITAHSMCLLKCQNL